MEKQRWLIFFVIVLAVSFFFQAYIFKPITPPNTESTSASQPASGPMTQATESSSETPLAEDTQATEEEEESSASLAEEGPEKQIVVESDTSRIEFSTRGAVPISWRIIDPVYIGPGSTAEHVNVLPANADHPGSRTLEMIEDIAGAKDREYPFGISIQEANRATNRLDAFNRRIYQVEQSTDADGAQIVKFTSPVLPGDLQLIKTFIIPRNGFLSKVSYEIVNRSDQSIRFERDGHGPGASWAAGLGGAEQVKGMGRSYSNRTTAVWQSGDETLYEEEHGMEVGGTRDSLVPVKWAGITNRYFFAALIPDQPGDGVRVSAKQRNCPPGLTKKGSARQTVEVFEAPLLLKPDSSAEYVYTVFVGPKSNAILRSADHDLMQIQFFTSWRWFRALSLFLMEMLIWLRRYLPNYGYSIIAATVIIRLVTQPFVQFSMRSNARFMKAQQRLKPELDEISKKFKDNPQKRNEETWKLYKKHNVNPLGMMKGCFWMILQMPIFFAFYRLLDASIELRGASFWWIHDLAQADHLLAFPPWIPLLGWIGYLNLLPILMTITQYLTTKLGTATGSDPMQKQMLYVMPVMFLFIMYNMSSGLVLYWFMSNLWQIVSQALINRTIKKEDDSAAKSPAPPVPSKPPEEPPAPRKRRGR